MSDLIQDNGPVRCNGTEFPVRNREMGDPGELALCLASVGLGTTVSLPHLRVPRPRPSQAPSCLSTGEPVPRATYPEAPTPFPAQTC